MKHCALRKTLAVCLLASFLLPLSGCRGGVKSIWAKFHHRRSKSKSNTTDYADNLEAITNSGQLGVLRWPKFSSMQAPVQQFYDGRNYELAWTRDGKPTEAAQALIEVFSNAAQKGLVPADYDADRWAGRVEELQKIAKKNDTSDAAQDTVAQFDVAMTVAAMRYVSDIHFGRVNPQALNFDIDVPGRRAQFDLPGFVDELVDADDVAGTLAPLEPDNPMYKATEQALPKYLQLAFQQRETPEQPLPAVEKPLSKGQEYPAMSALWARLQMEGDAPAGSPPPAMYDDAAMDAVKHFQERNGLTDDGKLTKATVDALNVPMQRRVQQIDDALERWRWLPENFQKPRVMVNLPEFMLRAYDGEHNLAFKMKVIDGEAEGNHDTPMFVRTMRFVIFRPYWNLPVSIVKKELAKHLEGGGGAYLERNNYEVVKGNEPVSGWTIQDLEQGRYLVRQKPGPKNSLGLVKFMFPNEYDIYMHSTPEIQLFSLTRRDRSHGCVRLHEAEKMADWVLDGQGDWDEDKIHQAMYGPTDGGEPDDNKEVGLKTPLTVNLTYLTANADEDGTMHFFADIYGYDQQLENALAKGRPYPEDRVKINPKLTPGETE